MSFSEKMALFPNHFPLFFFVNKNAMKQEKMPQFCVSGIFPLKMRHFFVSEGTLASPIWRMLPLQADLDPPAGVRLLLRLRDPRGDLLHGGLLLGARGTPPGPALPLLAAVQPQLLRLRRQERAVQAGLRGLPGEGLGGGQVRRRGKGREKPCTLFGRAGDRERYFWNKGRENLFFFHGRLNNASKCSPAKERFSFHLFPQELFPLDRAAPSVLPPPRRGTETAAAAAAAAARFCHGAATPGEAAAAE